MRTDIVHMTPDQIWRHARTAAGLVPTALSPLTVRSSPARGAIYACLLNEPRRPWTVNDVLGAVPEAHRPASGEIRSTMYMLLRDAVMARVPFQRALTARLTPEGVRLLRALVWQWGRNELHPARATAWMLGGSRYVQRGGTARAGPNQR